MKIIIGLGNPGRRYCRTRHNVGFMVVDALAGSLGIDVSHEKYHALVGRGRLDSEEALLVKPQTYMNESGSAARSILRYTSATVADLIVVHDDLDLPVGSVRVKAGGGHGGHNGLRSLMEQLGSADFTRVRIGIGRPVPGRDAADYVLSPFAAAEQQAAADALARAAEAVRSVASAGLTAAMNRFNQR